MVLIKENAAFSLAVGGVRVSFSEWMSHYIASEDLKNAVNLCQPPQVPAVPKG
jgi:hypothetical protein